MPNLHSHVTSQDFPMVGQENPQKILSLIADTVKHQKTQNKLFILHGSINTGKALYLSILKKKLLKYPLIDISSSELISSNIVDLKLMRRYLRSSLLLKIKETKTVYEGEVTEYTSDTNCTYLTLKTLKGSKRISIANTLSASLKDNSVSVGDVVYVESNSGIIKRLGRSESYFQDVDFESEKFVSLPKLDVMRRREILQEVTLNDLDQGHKDYLTDEMCKSIDNVIVNYISNGTCEVLRGLLIIRDCELLSEKALKYLESYSMSIFAPVIVLSTGCDDFLSKGLSRWMKIKLLGYSEEEIKNIVEMRMKFLNAEDGFDEVLKMAVEKGLNAAFVRIDEMLSKEA